jgi:hypothetical protein
VRLYRPTQVLAALKRLARRGSEAQPLLPDRPRAVLLQIDGLSSKRLSACMARGEMPHLRRWLDSGKARLRTLEAASAPSTPVFQAGLLYGGRGEVPGFGWFDRALGRTVRMDLAPDVIDVERTLHQRGQAPLLQHGVSYGTIWSGDAAEAFFNVVRFAYGAAASGRVVRNRYDRLLSTVAGLGIAGQLTSRFVLELGVGLWDFARWCARIHTTRFEWRFLYMRLFVAVVMREVATQGAIVDILRGVPLVYVDFLGYDEYAHRRGPDSEMALYNLRGVDKAIGRILHATEAVPEYRYDLYVFSDHGQSATLPFERVMGRDLHSFVLEHAADGVASPVRAQEIRELVALRELELWMRMLFRPLRPPVALYLGWLRRRISRRMSRRERAPLEAIRVVTGGSVAHLYFGARRSHPPDVDEIARRWPRMLDALAHCRAIGLVAGRSAQGPVVLYRGHRYALSDRHALEPLEPFRAVGYDLLRLHLEQAALGHRSGDLVLYGAFCEAGNVSFDFEFGSHGGVAPEELDQFAIHPAQVDFPLTGAVPAEAFYRFFHSRYDAA